MNPNTPCICSNQFTEEKNKLIPDATLELKPINSDYGSWRLNVTKGKMEMEFVWGPLSGFGGSDLSRPTSSDDTPFDYADKEFHSVEEALTFLKVLIQKYTEPPS